MLNGSTALSGHSAFPAEAVGQLSIDYPAHVRSFPYFNGCEDGGDQLDDVEQQDNGQIDEIPDRPRCVEKKNGNRPPEQGAVYEECRDLSEEGLHAMSAHKMGGGFAVC